MKVAIITITDGQNYGNRLQNYALQQLLKKTGAEVVTIQRRTSRDLRGIAKIKKDFKHGIKILLGNPSDKWRRVRRKRFNEFNKKYIKFSNEILENNQAPNGLKDKYDYFVCGSDQVWNAHFDIIQEDIKNYLAFFARSQQKISYAASFGTDDIALGYERIFSKYLSDFKAISVRENSGIELVRKTCGRENIEVVLDPTMMINAEEWAKVSKKPNHISKEKFIVTYFLGGRGENVKKYIETIEKIYQCKAHNLEIEFKIDKEISSPLDFVTAPDEFVWMIQHAECVLTDSFHATVLSILFHKPFCVFERNADEMGNNMGSRIETLLAKFELLQYRGTLNNMNIYPGNYSGKAVDDILYKERQKSMKFLSTALGVL